MLRKIAINLIDVYQRYVRIILPSCCRFAPTCSEYVREAIIKYGFFWGVLKGIKRLCYCHPFSHKAGYDPLI